MASVIYNSFKKKIMDGSIDLDTDDIKVALVTSTYTPDQDAHDFFDDITNEVGASGSYAAGGSSLAGKAVTQDNTDNEGVFDANDLAFTSATITARAAILYKNTGVASTSPLIAYIDFGSNQSSSTGTFTIIWDSEGILNLN
jgi:hypothetical protein